MYDYGFTISTALGLFINTLLQSLLVQCKAITLPMQQFNLVAATVYKDEDTTICNFPMKVFPDQPAQPIKTLAKICLAMEPIVR